MVRMGKMDETILAVNRKYLFDDEGLTFQGFTDNKGLIKEINRRLGNFIEVRRGDAEEDSELKQPIPYAIIKRGEEVFLYRRLNSGGEHRLHDQLSIGVGGHMNRVGNIQNWKDTLYLNMVRELTEELTIRNTDGAIEPEIVGLINNDHDPEKVGLYHIGILAVLELPEHVDVEVRETDVLEGYWIRIRDLKKTPLFESLESWSQIAVEVL